MVWFQAALIVFAILLGGGAEAHDSDYVQLQQPRGESCIRPTEWMQRNHMEFLKHRRAETVREGVRIRDESLLQCVSCHPSREQFCERCHDFVGVDPNCFQCHVYPE